MKLQYWLCKFREAVEKEDYDEQTRIAKKLMLFEACGMLEEDILIRIINNPALAISR